MSFGLRQWLPGGSKSSEFNAPLAVSASTWRLTGKPEVEPESCEAGQKAASARLGTINTDVYGSGVESALSGAS